MLFLIHKSRRSSWKHLGKRIYKNSWAEQPVAGKRAEAAVLGVALGDSGGAAASAQALVPQPSFRMLPGISLTPSL